MKPALSWLFKFGPLLGARRIGLLWVALLLSGSGLRAEWDPSREKPPRHWPNSLNVRNDEPGCWQPPSDRFSRPEALKAVATPLAASLDPSAQVFGDIPADLHIEGFVRLRLPLPRQDGRGVASTAGELSVAHLGPRGGKNPEVIDEAAIKPYYLLTAHGQLIWGKELMATGTGVYANHYRLSRVVTQFDRAPWVLLFTDSGGNTRNFSYTLLRVTPSGWEIVWDGEDLNDGHSGSVQQGYEWSNFDFSRMRSGRANEFTVHTTSGIRRLMLPGDEQFKKPRYIKRVYRWDRTRAIFVKAYEHTFTKS